MKITKKINSLTHKFVENIPDKLEPGVIYISIKYATAIHLCCCGCGNEVVTPISPTDWKLIFDGESVTILPSIGNWSLACKSHYWIDRNNVIWARQWSSKEIEISRYDDTIVKQKYFKIEANHKSKRVVNKEKKPKR